MAGVVVGLGGGMPRSEGLVEAGSLQSLDLALLVDGEHHGMGGWVHVEADDVLDLLGKSWIVGSLEGPDPMRLQAMRLPDPLDGAQYDDRMLIGLDPHEPVVLCLDAEPLHGRRWSLTGADRAFGTISERCAASVRT